MKISSILKGSICVLGLVGAGNFFAAPANAGDAAARAAVTVSRADGATQSVSGEVVLPSGLYFLGATPATQTLLVTPVIATPGTTTESITTLALSAGTPTAIPTGGTIQGVIIDILQGDNAVTGSNAASIQDASAIIKAAGGVNGLGGLE
ncbi:hypothetical protein LC613_20275 [Nostoc sphaeroides CHAB 2801]|uniref:hypothetical protein n=1 Tax=Nostoc sphaeroides TaxID=446679 RepID=UPI000E52C49D|nr:hypothetical protein [Nostoc sphaeroides]MCC5630226.1 hypothetical protein [Nostoc sphaeroides CHAB 2801]